MYLVIWNILDILGMVKSVTLALWTQRQEAATSSAWPRSEFQASYKYTVMLPLPFNCLMPYILVGVLKTL